MTLSASPDFAKMGRFVDGQTPERNDSSRLRGSTCKNRAVRRYWKILECREVGRWLQVVEEVPEQGERHAQVGEPWVVHRQEAD